ncbi:hypothetical protein PAXRUDRAFT_621936, partial [Paxillus rubicundulus Ve08.2h10]
MLDDESLHQGENSEAGPSGSTTEPESGIPVIFNARSGRQIRLPARYTDYLPAAPHGLRHVPPLSPQCDSPAAHTNQPSRSPSPQEPLPLVEYRTSPDDLGLFRIYPSQPTLFPEQADTIHVVADAPTFEQPPPSLCNPPTVHSLSPTGDITPENLYSAFSSPTAGLLMCWQYSGSNSKSAAELNRLWSFIQDSKFDPTLHTSFSH